MGHLIGELVTIEKDRNNETKVNYTCLSFRFLLYDYGDDNVHIYFAVSIEYLQILFIVMKTIVVGVVFFFVFFFYLVMASLDISYGQ